MSFDLESRRPLGERDVIVVCRAPGCCCCCRQVIGWASFPQKPTTMHSNIERLRQSNLLGPVRDPFRHHYLESLILTTERSQAPPSCPRAAPMGATRGRTRSKLSYHWTCINICSPLCRSRSRSKGGAIGASWFPWQAASAAIATPRGPMRDDEKLWFGSTLG